MVDEDQTGLINIEELRKAIKASNLAISDE